MHDLGTAYSDQAERAWQRELDLQSQLARSGDLAPLDRNSTWATLSTIRDRGNNAAHEGSVTQGQRLVLEPTPPQPLPSSSTHTANDRRRCRSVPTYSVLRGLFPIGG